MQQIPLMYRVMLPDQNGKPIIHNDFGLGAREKVKRNKGKWSHGDVKVGDDGKVVLDNSGMSVFSQWERIHPGRLPMKNGGQNSDAFCIFRMGEGPFINGIAVSDHLVFFYSGHGYHGTIPPAKPVSIELYREHLAATKRSWVLQFPEDGNVN